MNPSPQERINQAFKGLEIEDDLFRVITKTVNQVHKAHTEVLYDIIAEALEELAIERLLYLCRTGHAKP
jgi:hypothetical protein